MVTQVTIELPQRSRGYHLITDLIEKALPPLPEIAMVNLFIKHTSAALTINENADPSVRNDLRTFVDELIPDGYPKFTHTIEGTDDMSAHIKSSFFGPSLTIPVTNHQLALGTWQGIYLCEFRNHSVRRTVVITVYS
ncbi:MAG TPA: secondary thiamine-phosphate synthase enzyme YjbQ [Williamwhitmania sp.]|jgi:secondary thiamine-phosphate synthase enzyme|nr:secondary thiamine-phosphate synthase enzyme YjbQ [Williamwhitmania sp.]